MKNEVLIDSSFLIALFDQADQHHDEVVAFLEIDKSPRVIADVVLPEVAHILRGGTGYRGVLLFLDALISTYNDPTTLLMADIARARAIMGVYEDSRLDLVDCCLMALSERLEITRICTFDYRDFNMVRPPHCEHFELLPRDYF